MAVCCYCVELVGAGEMQSATLRSLRQPLRLILMSFGWMPPVIQSRIRILFIALRCQHHYAAGNLPS